MGSMSWLPGGGRVLGAQSQWNDTSADLLEPLPKKEGIIVEEDYFSRFLEVTVLKSTASAKIIEAIHPMHICLV